MTDKDLDDIDAQIDSSVPYYVPTLTREIRSLRARLLTLEQALLGLRSHNPDYSAGPCWCGVSVGMGLIHEEECLAAEAALAASRGREPQVHNVANMPSSVNQRGLEPERT